MLEGILIVVNILACFVIWMFLQDPNVQTAIKDTFLGSLIRLDSYSVDQQHALYAANCNYLQQEVSTRLGHSQVFSVISGYGPTSSLYNWAFEFGGFALGVTPISIACYYCPAAGVGGHQQFPVEDIPASILFPVVGAAGASLQGAGNRLYGAFYTAAGNVGYQQGLIYGWNIGTDTLFAAPLTNTITVTQPGSGNITAGPHNFGYQYTTRNGYTGPLSPVAAQATSPGYVFAPTQVNLTGGTTLSVTLNGPFPTYMVGANAQLQLVMTTTTDLAQYFAIPGALIEGLSGGSVTFTVNISDEILAQTGTDVTAYQDLLAQNPFAGSPALAGPFFPSALATYSSRMVYVTIDGAGIPVVYYSNQNAFQYLTADQHGIYLQGQAQPIQTISLRGVSYILTQYATYSVEDTGDVPVLWTPPQLVDGSIGILSPTCVTVNPSQGYAGVASDRGFYIFQGGIYPALPLSYFQQPDWGRINWNVPTTVQVVDDSLNKRFLVTVPLNATIAAVSGTGPYTITTSIPNGINAQSDDTSNWYQTGLQCQIDGVTGIQTITVTNHLNMFTIPGGSGVPTVGGMVRPQTANALMTWDYTQGDTPETVKYSLNAFGAYNVGAIASVQNTTTKLQEVWYTPSVQGVGIRQNDGQNEALPYQDVDSTGNPTSYSWVYETSLFPGPQEPNATVPSSTLHTFFGAHFRIAGQTTSGNGLNLEIFSLDHATSLTPVLSPLQLTQFPGFEYLVKWNLSNTEQQSIKLSMIVLNTNAFLNLIRAYYTESAPQRNG